MHCYIIFVDLPSLRKIQCPEQTEQVFQNMGIVVLESNIFKEDIIIDIPNLVDNCIDYGRNSFIKTADLQSKSMLLKK